jgi:hypothetical protein
MNNKKCDNSAPGQGIDGGKDEGFQTKNIDKAALKAMYGDDADISPKTPSRKI